MSLRILYSSAEVAPLAKTGGLADVSGALPPELARRGHDVRVVMPLYRRIREGNWRIEAVPGLQDQRLDLGPNHYRYAVARVRVPERDLDVLCLDCPGLYDRAGIYTSSPDEHRRFAFLARASLATCEDTNWAPDVFHAHDWHVGLGPLYVKLLSSWNRLFARTKTVLTIHNVGYQGTFGPEVIHDLGLEDSVHLLHQEELAAGRVGFLLTGILYADALTTVSRTHADEIRTDELGMGLQEFLRARSDRLVGIVNGVDYATWSPETDEHAPQHYSAETLDRKAVNKAALLQRMGLAPGDAPVFGIVTRFVYQKGLDLLFDTLPALLRSTDVRVAALGSGEPKYEQFFTELAKRYPRHVGYSRAYDEPLAHLITAGADFFLMPSRYEPCGLNQMYSLRYGTIPIVHRTGGLADTVEPFNRSTGRGTGIVFGNHEPQAMAWAFGRALELYADREAWDTLRRQAMAQDFSWTRQAAAYDELYRRLVTLP